MNYVELAALAGCSKSAMRGRLDRGMSRTAAVEMGKGQTHSPRRKKMKLDTETGEYVGFLSEWGGLSTEPRTELLADIPDPTEYERQLWQEGTKRPRG